MIDVSTGSLPRSFKPAVVIAVCFSIAVLEGYDIQALGVAAPAMGRALHLAKAQIGFAGSAAMVGLMIGAVFGGWLADQIGRKPVLVASAVWFGLFSLVTALAVDADTLMLARLATGLGFGGALPNMIAVAAEISAPRRRAATVTYMTVGMPAGGTLAALVTRLTPDAFDWRLIFIIGGVLPLAVAPLAGWLLPETRPAPAEGKQMSFPALFGGGRWLPTILLWLAFGFTLMAQYLMLNWLPTLAIAKGLAKDTAALAAIVYNLAGVGGALLLGLIVDRFGYRWPFITAYLGVVAAMAGLVVATGVVPILLLTAIAGFLLIGGLFLLYGMAPFYYPATVRATGTGAAVGVGRLGSVAGPAIGGLLLAGGASAGQVVQSILPMVITAGLAAVLLAVLARPYAGGPAGLTP
nr:MFS transporter [Phenylobacterium sp.]